MEERPLGVQGAPGLVTLSLGQEPPIGRETPPVVEGLGGRVSAAAPPLERVRRVGRRGRGWRTGLGPVAEAEGLLSFVPAEPRTSDVRGARRRGPRPGVVGPGAGRRLGGPDAADKGSEPV